MTDADVCVVGSGPTAQAVAIAAARNGRAVLMLEAGSSGPDSRQFAHALHGVWLRSAPNAPNPGEHSAIRLGGSAALPAISLDPSQQRGDGIRLTRLTTGDFAPRPLLDARLAALRPTPADRRRTDRSAAAHP